MKKTFRKISALLMTIVMVLSMCTAVFAAKDSATITVNGADGATLTYAQVIVADTTTKTGWNFVGGETGVIAEAYRTAFGMNDGQSVLEAMTQTNAAGEFTVDAEKLGLAQAKAAVALGENGFKTMTNGQTVTAPGVYLVKATKEGWSYNIMAAYVGFSKVTIDEKGNYKYSNLENAEITAKKTEVKISKAVEDEGKDNVTHTGDILTYTITTTVPYIAATETNKKFMVYDELTGAKYNDLSSATIKLNGEPVTGYTINKDSEAEKFSVDLKGMINDANSNAGYTVEITYTVTVTSDNDTVTNKASASHNNNEKYESETVETYEGNITLTKTNDYKTDADKKLLAGAGFEVRKDNGTDALYFVKLKEGVYKYEPDEKVDGRTTKVVTKADGTVTIKGLDVGTYKFKEVEAPNGYSINTTADAKVELKVTAEGGKATAILHQDTNMKDTKLGALPSTGGIGTYIFTIAGVVLMACAAGAFFISRKKSEE